MPIVPHYNTTKYKARSSLKITCELELGKLSKGGGVRLRTLSEPQLTPLQPETLDIQSALSISGGTKVAQILKSKELIFLQTCVILWNTV